MARRKKDAEQPKQSDNSEQKEEKKKVTATYLSKLKAVEGKRREN